jgi:hypothetical protein
LNRIGGQDLPRDLDQRAPGIHGRGAQAPVGVLLAQLLALHEAALRPLDHLAVFEGLFEPVHFVKTGYGKIEGRCKLPGAERFERERHHSGVPSPCHEGSRRIPTDEDDRTGGDRCHLRGHLQGITIGQLCGHDGHVRLGVSDDVDRADAAVVLGDRAAAGGDNDVTEGAAKTRIGLENRHPPARWC